MPSPLDVPPVNLYLIGFMGVGKSAVGRGVAKVLRHRFIDSDAAIERRAGVPISRLFAEKGEAAFRELEREFMLEGHPPQGCVVACGGGLPIPPGMRELLLDCGVVVCLFASEETILERTSRNNKRPILNVEDPAARVRQLLHARMPIYSSTGTGISTENRKIGDIVDHVVRVYCSEAPRFARAHPLPGRRNAAHGRGPMRIQP